MRARTIAAVLALAAALGAGVASAAPEGYTHVWRVQSETGGVFGGTFGSAVVRDDVTLALKGGAYDGTVRYADRLAMQDSAGRLFAQVADIELTLQGAPQEAAAAAAGTFSGTATIREYEGVTVADAVAGRLPGTPRGTAVYAVGGAWTARVTGVRADGEVLYQRVAEVSRTGAAVRRDASWFDRLGVGLGDPQEFSTVVVGLAPRGGQAPGAGKPTLTDYLKRGLADTRPVLAPPVPADLSRAARQLRDMRPKGGAALPGGALVVDLDVAGLVLDAKNAAASGGGEVAESPILRDAWRAAEASATTAVSSPASATVRAWADRLASALATSTAPGAEGLRAAVASFASTSAVSVALPSDGVRARALAAESVAAAGTRGSVLRSTASVASWVADTALPRTGAYADAVRAAADLPSAPSSALAVRSFVREARLDTSIVGGEPVAGRLLATWPEKKDGVAVLRWATVGGVGTSASPVWRAYRRADGRAFLLASDAEVALTDITLPGWGFSRWRAGLVDARRAGRLLAVFEVTGEAAKVTAGGVPRP